MASLATKYVRPDGEIPIDTRGTFSFGERIGLFLVTEAAFLSFIFIGILLAKILYEAFKRWRLKRIGWPPQLYMYFVSLLLSDFFQAIGAMLNVKWIHNAGVNEGPYCTAQGIVKQLGDVGVAFATIAIAVQTFGTIIGRWSRFTESSRAGLTVVACIWLFLALIISISVGTHMNSLEPFYGNTKYWCSVRSPPYLKTFIAVEYVWLWVALLTSFFLYTGLAVFVYRQHVQADTGSSITSLNGQSKAIKKLAFKMMFYPLIYSICIMPQSIVRFIQFSRNAHPPPFAASAFAAITFSSSGFLNVLLYAYTRPSLLPRNPTAEDDESMDKFPDVNHLESVHPEDSLSALEMHRHSRRHPSHVPRRHHSYSDRIVEVNGNRSRDRTAYGENEDLEPSESIDELRRQLEEHERSLGQIQEKLSHSSGHRAATF